MCFAAVGLAFDQGRQRRQRGDLAMAVGEGALVQGDGLVLVLAGAGQLVGEQQHGRLVATLDQRAQVGLDVGTRVQVQAVLHLGQAGGLGQAGAEQQGEQAGGRAVRHGGS